MNKNEIFILCLGISIAIIFFLIIFFAKKNTVLILMGFVISTVVILLGICLFLMNNMLDKLDTNTKSTNTICSIFKFAVLQITKINKMYKSG